MKNFTFTDTTCVFSDNRQYRYSLVREWTKPGFAPTQSGHIVFVGLSPSTANEDKVDPTVTRCIRYACRRGFSRMVMLNLFAYRAIRPLDLKRVENPIGEAEKEVILDRYLTTATEIILCWGSYGTYLNRASAFLSRLQALGVVGKCKAFCITNADQPGQPFQLAGAIQARPVEIQVKDGNPFVVITEEPIKALPLVAISKEDTKTRTKRKRRRSNPGAVYVVDIAGALTSDPVAIKKYHCLSVTNKSARVLVHGRVEDIKVNALCRIFRNETSAANYLSNWLEEEERATVARLENIRSLRARAPLDALNAIVVNTTP